jgi:hypothetical protein
MTVFAHMNSPEEGWAMGRGKRSGWARWAGRTRWVLERCVDVDLTVCNPTPLTTITSLITHLSHACLVTGGLNGYY